MSILVVLHLYVFPSVHGGCVSTFEPLIFSFPVSLGEWHLQILVRTSGNTFNLIVKFIDLKGVDTYGLRLQFLLFRVILLICNQVLFQIH